MQDKSFLERIDLFKKASHEPKYKQIVDAVIEGVRSNKIFNKDKLPSINALSKYYSISRDTVQKAYDQLREKGVIEAAQGKGFTICNDSYNKEINVLVIFDVLNAYKEKIYNGIKDTLDSFTDSSANVDFFFHHYNENLIEQFLENNAGKYEYYVVMLFENEKITEYIKKLDQRKLLLVDRCINYSAEGVTRVAQDHNQELKRALTKGCELIKKYQEFVLCFPDGYFIPEMIKDAYSEFCVENGFTPIIIDKFTPEDVYRHNAYLVIEDSDLVNCIKTARSKGLKVGVDVGVLSYNDTPLKEIIEGGVTVVSIDFYRMGRLVAEQIVKRDVEFELLATELIVRNTL